MLYDLFPLIGLWIVASGLWVLAFHGIYDPQHPDPALRVLLGAWLVVVAGAYFVVSWSGVRATIGMRAWKLRLLRVDGSRVGAWRASARFVLALASLAVVGCGFWIAWFDADRRAWHDRVCGTRVIRCR